MSNVFPLSSATFAGGISARSGCAQRVDHHHDRALRFAEGSSGPKPSVGASGAPTLVDPQWKLTRRGRIVVALFSALLLAAALWGLSASRAQAESVAKPAQYVTVQSGETLWQLAARVAPGDDRREVIAQLMKTNDLNTAVVQAGQRLQVPVAP